MVSGAAALLLLFSACTRLVAQDPYVATLTDKPIPRVGTSTPAFIGFTEKGGRKILNQPIRITSIRDYERMFGGAETQSIEIDVDESGGAVQITVDASTVPDHFLYYSVLHYFENGGGPCYVVSVGDYGAAFTTSRFTDALKELEKIDEVTLVVMPELVLGNASQAGDLADAALAHAEKMQDRFVILDVPNAVTGGVDNISDVSSTFRSQITNQSAQRRFGAAYYPYLNTSIPIDYDERSVTIRSHTNPAGKEIVAGTTLRDKSLQRDRGDIYRAIVAKLDQVFVTIPPSGAVAGAYVATDSRRGVWKAPANVSVNRVVGPAVNVDQSFNDALNVDASSGKSVNAIRAISGKGTMIWGSRTLDGNANDFRYVPVARFMIMVQESLDKGLDWVVFEPNNNVTWSEVRTRVDEFLTGLYRAGAFAGSKPSEAYFAKVGLGLTMTASDISDGKLVLDVGVAPLKPAEFILIRIQKKMQR